jgi:malic enzyme
VAIAAAKQAQADGLADPVSDEELVAAIHAKMWEPVYANYRRLRG